MRPPTLESSKKKAWTAFSKFIRERDKRCVTCGSVKDLQAGHFHHACLDFCEININAQCSYCNKYKHGNLAIYASYLIKKHGLKVFEDLDTRHYLALRGEYRSIQDYQALEAKHKALLE